MAPRDYEIEVSHPTGFHAGKHMVTVRDNYGATTVYCAAVCFGCSRDYDLSDDRAIKAWLAEHGCSVLSIRYLDPPARF